MISICIEVTNRSDMDIGWDAVFDFLECGFESSVWGSSIDPMIGAEINRFESVSLSSGKSQRIWFFTEVQKVCFKESSWENIADYKYSYVLSLIPQKVAVRLDV